MDIQMAYKCLYHSLIKYKLKNVNSSYVHCSTYIYFNIKTI